MKNKIILPSNWKWVTLNDIGIVVSGGTPSTKEPEFWSEEIPWITPSDLSSHNEIYISKGSRNISRVGLDYSSAKLLPKNTILFSSRAPIGYVAIAKNGLSTNQGFKNLILTQYTNPKYVYYYLTTIKELAEEMASGTTFLEISGSKFKQIPFPIAKLEEQNRIVNKIEELFSELDNAQEQLRSAKNKVKLTWEQTLNGLFESKISEFADFELLDKINDLDEVSTIRRTVPPIKKTISSPYVYVYELLRKGIITDLKDGNHGERHPKKEDFSQKGIPFLTANLFAKKYSINYEQAHKLEGQALQKINIGISLKNDVILTHKGTVGRTAVNLKKSICSPQTTYYRLNVEYLLPKYLMYYFSSSIFQTQLNRVKEQTTRDFVSISKQYLLQIIILPIDFQREMVELFDERYLSMQLMKNEIDNSVQKIDLTRKKILQEAFLGKLVEQIDIDDSVDLILSKIKDKKREYQKSLDKPIQKIVRNQKTLEGIIIKNFKGRAFSFDELGVKANFSAEKIKREIFDMLDKKQNLEMFFDEISGEIKYKYNENKES